MENKENNSRNNAAVRPAGPRGRGGGKKLRILRKALNN